MKAEELYVYALYLIQKQVQENSTVFIFADVMCKLWPFILRVAPLLSSKIKGALSVMHAKGHSLDCQVINICQRKNVLLLQYENNLMFLMR